MQITAARAGRFYGLIRLVSHYFASFMALKTKAEVSMP